MPKHEPTDAELENQRMLLADMTELVRAWKLRGFESRECVVALISGAMVACQGSGMTRDQVADLVNHFYGAGRPVVPAAKA